MEESNLDQNSGVNIQPQNNIPQTTPVEVKAPNSKNKLPVILAIIFLFIILGSGVYYYLGVKKNSKNKACPDIARICKDGSTAKPGPNCTQTCPEDSIVTPTDVSKINNFNLTSSKENVDENWNSYKDKNYNLTIKYPNSWKVNKLQSEYLENIPTFEIKTQTTFKTLKTYSDKIGMTIGSPFIFSTSGAVCANTSCDEVGKANIIINGKIYSAPIIGSTYDPKQNIFAYYAFQFELKDVTVSLPGYTEKISPAVTAYFYTPEEGQTITNILSTFKFTENVAPTESAGKSAKTLAYQLPSNWQTIKDTSGKFEVGYDPSQYTVNALQSRIDLNSKQCCASIFVKLLPYDGASRHQFISKNTGALKLPNTIEKEYLVSGKTALFQYNVDYSSVVTVGMVVANNSEAWLIESTTSNQAVIEQFISTLKLIN